ncbi:MAG: DUF389 domain-containing protein [Candidatus Helarchaeota archaeon]
MRQIQLTIPNEKLQSIINVLVMDFKLKGIHTLSGETDSLIIIRSSVSRVDEIVEHLNNIGVGITYGIIDILDLKATIPPLGEIERVVPDRVTTKTAIEEIYNEIMRNARISINFIVFNLLAAIVAGLGIITNNLVTIVASMILSTFMGPMLGYSYGYVIKDKDLRKESSRAQIIGFLMCWITGLVIGVLYFPYNTILKSMALNLPMDTLYGITGFEPIIIITSIVIATCSGIAVGFSLTVGSSAVALVGIAIAATLVPAIVKSGLSISISLGSLLTGNIPFFSWEMSIALGSLTVFGINLFCIIVSSIIVFRLKKVRAPIKTWLAWRGPKLPKTETLQPEIIEEPQGVFGGFWRRLRGEGRQKGIKKLPARRKITKEEIKKEIEEELKRDMTERVKKEMKEELKHELKEVVKEELQDEVKEVVKEKVKEGMKEAVRDVIKDENNDNND